MSKHEKFINQLEELAENNQPNNNFVDTLETQLRATHLELQPEKTSMMSRVFKSSGHRKEKRKRKPASPMRWLAATLSLVITVGLFLTIPPLRNTALSVMDVFYPPELNFFQATNEEFISTYNTEPPTLGHRYRPMETLKLADEEVVFDFLVLPEQESLEVIHISADHNALLMIYYKKTEKEESIYGDEYTLPNENQKHCLASGIPQPICYYADEYLSVVSLYQLELPNGLLAPMTTFATDFKQEIVRVNGSSGAYVQSGVWSLYLPLYEGSWQRGSSYYPIGNAHRLAWQDGDIVYVLTMSEFLADDVSDIIAVAEQLKPYIPDEDS